MFLRIAAGALIGVPGVAPDGVPLTLSVAGGVLLAGIASGWQRVPDLWQRLSLET